MDRVESIRSKKSIARRLIVAIVLFSSLITLLITVIQLYLDYRQDIFLIESRFQQIQNVNLKSLSDSLWHYDQQKLQIQLDGLLQLPDMLYLEIREGEKLWATAGTPDSESIVSRQYRMTYILSGKEQEIGVLMIVASLEGIYQRLIDKTVIILISNGIKTLFVAGFIFFVVQWMITRHLVKISNFLQKQDLNEMSALLAIDRQDSTFSKGDELDHMVQTINEMRKQLGKSFVSLKEQQELLNTTLLSIGDAIIATDEKATVSFLNPVAEHLTGWSNQEAQGRNLEEIFNIVNEQTRQPVESPVHRVLREGVVVGLANHTILIGRDGSEIPIDDSGAPIRSGNEILGVVLVFRDVTKRRQVEETLRESEQKYKTLVENSPSAIFVAQDDMIKFANPRIENILAYTTEEITSKSFVNFIHKDDQQLVLERHRRRLQGEVLPNNYSFRVVGKDGEIKWVELMTVPFTWENRAAILCFLNDITTRKQAEETIRMNSQVLENMSEGVNVADKTGTIILANSAFERMFGYDPHEMIGLHASQLNVETAEEYQQIANEIIESIYTQGFWEGEFHNRKKDGTKFQSYARINTIELQGKLHWVSVQEDITKRKRLEEQLRQSQKMEALGTLAGGIAHDFNNMLAVILGNTELGLAALPQKSRERDFLKNILEAGERANSLVRQILIFSRMEAIHLKPVNLSSVVKEALKMVKATIPAQIKIHQNLPEEEPAIMADTIQIHQILLNLCTNASHAMEATGGVLEVRVEALDQCPPSVSIGESPCLKLSVKDNGPGMPSEVQERIFDPFFTTKERGKGTGIGLSVVHGIVEQHLGAITVESELGQGTTFSLFFPITEEEGLEEPAIEIPVKKVSDNSTLSGESAELTGGPDPASTHGHFEAPTSPAYRKQHILIVEDEASIRNTYRAFLEDYGYEITICEHGHEALSLFRESPEQFDLVLTDQSMPQMTGQQLAQELFTLQPNLPIILSTGYSDVISEKEARAMGIQQYLIKPFQLTTLHQIIEECLAGIRK